MGLYFTTIDASMTVEDKWVFLIDNLLEVNGFDMYEKKIGEDPCVNEECDMEMTQFNIHTYMHYSQKINNLFAKAEELMDKIDKIRDKMITDLQTSMYDVLAPYQKELGLENGIGIDSEYDINESVNNLNDVLIELLTYQMREDGLLEVNE